MRTTESDVSSAVRPDSISISQSDDRAVLVFAEQIRAASVTIPARFVAGAISGILITVVMSREVPFKSLATWLIALYVALGYMLFLYFQYKRAAPTPAQARNWTTRFLFASLLHGSAWGVAGIVMFQSEFTIYQMWLTLALFMVAMAAVTTGTSAFLPLVYAFVLPTISPILIREAIEADFLHWSIMATGIVFVAIIFYLAAKMNDLMVESFNLRFDNELARNRAEEASRAKTRFLASASHDLRQPLHTLSLYSAALKLRAPDGTTGEIAGHIDRAIASLSLLVNSLLDISKLDAGAVQPEPQRVGAKALIERIATDFRPLAAERGLAFQVTAADVQVDTDPVLLERLVRNLVDNAFKYTAAGGVSLAAEGGSDGLRIAVRDTGTGIPAGERERIFEEFYQIANPERDRSQGLGLGLAIVRRLAQLLGLEVELESELGRGSTFAVTVPIARESLVSPAAGTPVLHNSRSLDGTHVLVVDDEREVLTGMQTLLEHLGCRVTACDGYAAADRLLDESALKVDLIVADFRLRQHENGIDTVRRLRARVGEVPALLISGDTAPERLREAKLSGLPFLHKPVSADTLTQAMLAALER